MGPKGLRCGKAGEFQVEGGWVQGGLRLDCKAAKGTSF